MLKRTKKIAVIASITLLCAFNACLATSSTDNDKEVKALYEKAVERYEYIERKYAHLVSVNGISMAYLDFGPKEGVPLIWAHGSNWTGYEILNVKEGLIDAGYRVIAIDYRGHGKTQITDFNTSLYDVADDIAALMDRLFISKAVVGGWSKGGFIATAFYDEYPDRTLGLLLEDGGSWSGEQLHDEQSMTEETLKEIEAQAQLKNTHYTTRFEAFQASLGPNNKNLSQFSIDMAVNALAKRIINNKGKWVNHVNTELMLGDFSGFKHKASPSRHPLMQWSQQAMIPEVIFRQLDIPVSIVDPVSDEDGIPVSQQNRQLKNQHPELIVHEIYEETSHAAHLQRPERFVDTARALLARVRRQALDATHQ